MSTNQLIGQTIANRWQIVQYIGEGSMSSVYKAQDIETNKAIILKLIKYNFIKDINDLQPLIKQARAYVALNHENIGNYYNIHYEDNQLFLFCDYLQGENLASLLAKIGKLPLDKSIHLFKKIIAGINHAHEKKLWHGDLRPSNIFIVNDQFNIDEPKVVDFGIMLLINQISQKNKLYVTSTHPALGNASYMSPEQKTGMNIDQRSDLYSIGCLMYEVIAGKPPFVSRSAIETTYKQMHQMPTELNQLSVQHPLLSRYQSIVDKLLKTDKVARYQSATALLHDLDLLSSADENGWCKNAFASKKTAYKISASKWQTLAVNSILIFFVSILVRLIIMAIPNFQPWSPHNFDNNKLWIIQDKSTKKSSPYLLKQKTLLEAKLFQIEKNEGITSKNYIENLFSLCQLLLKTGEWEEAKTKLDEVVSKDSSSHYIDSNNLLAAVSLAQFMTDDLVMAEQSSNALLQTANNSEVSNKITTLTILGDIYNQRNEISQAENIYSRLYQLAKQNRLSYPTEYAHACVLLADLWRKENKLFQAEQLYKEGIDWGENYIGHKQMFMAKAYYGLALVYYQQNNLELADKQLLQALSIATAQYKKQNNFIDAIKSLQSYILFHKNITLWSAINLTH